MIGKQTIAAALLLASAGQLRAEPAPAPADLLGAALSAIQAQRNAGLDDAVQAQAELTLARREVARLRAELEEARRPRAEPPQAAAPVEAGK